MQTNELKLTSGVSNGPGWTKEENPLCHSEALQRSILERLYVASHCLKSGVSSCSYFPLRSDKSQPTFVFFDDVWFDKRQKPAADWIVAAQSSKVLTIPIITLIMKEINDRLINAEFARLDIELASLNVHKMGPDGISAVARITATARDKLASWSLFVDTSSSYLSKHFPESRALEGLPSAFGRQSVSASAHGGRGNNKAFNRGFSLGDAIRQWRRK